MQEKTYTAKEIEAMIAIPCCHVSGMHDPVHFQEGRYICESQQAHALQNLCKTLGINPVTKSRPDCGWCNDYPEKKKGEGKALFSEEKN